MAEAQAQENKAPEPGTPEYDQAMAAKVDENAKKALEAAGSKALEEPSVEDSKKDESKPAEAAKEEAQKDEKKEGEGKTQEEAAKEALENKGLNIADFSKEFDEKGSLSEDSYKKLSDAGIPKEMVDSYIAGQEALATQRIYVGYDAAGGQENFAQMVEWAKTSMTKAEIDAFNKSVAAGTSTEEMTQAILGLRSRFESEYGRQPGLLGGRNPSGNVGAYESKAQMVADMKDPRYAKDDAFRAQVERKLANTTAF